MAQSNSRANLALPKTSSSSAHGGQGLADGIAVGAQARGHLHQDAVDLAHLLFGEADQFVVEIDGFQRLDEEGVAAGAGAVDDAIHLAPLPGDEGHHEALVADGDELLLQDAFVAVLLEEAFERFLNGLLLALDIAAQAVEGDAGVIGDAAVGQDLAVELAQQGAEFADGPGARAEQGKAFGAGGEIAFGVGGHIEQGEERRRFRAAPARRLRCGAC